MSKRPNVVFVRQLLQKWDLLFFYVVTTCHETGMSQLVQQNLYILFHSTGLNIAIIWKKMASEMKPEVSLNSTRGKRSTCWRSAVLVESSLIPVSVAVPMQINGFSRRLFGNSILSWFLNLGCKIERMVPRYANRSVIKKVIGWKKDDLTKFSISSCRLDMLHLSPPDQVLARLTVIGYLRGNGICMDDVSHVCLILLCCSRIVISSSTQVKL